MFWFQRLGRLRKYLSRAGFPFVHCTFLLFKSTMRLTDFTIAKVRRRRRCRRTRLLLALSLKSTHAAFFALQRSEQLRRDLNRAIRRLRHIQSIQFNLNNYSEQQSLRDFRFRPSEISRIAEIIGYDEYRTKRSRYRTNKILAACIVMRRLAAPCRWNDLEFTFGVRIYALSEIFWEALEEFVHKRSTLLQTFRSSLMVERAQLYAESICCRGSPLDKCVGFIDCTKIQMQRPGGANTNQRAVYSGHKRFHCLVYQTITTPDGLIFHMHGPQVGRRHDITLYRQSGLDDILENSLLIDGQQFYIYGDQAYMIRPWLQVAFSRAWASEQQIQFNTAMSSVRETVEWSYKDLKQMWSSQDYTRMLKVRKAPVALMYKGAALLWNFKVCLQHGGEVQSFFSCTPPTLQRYLQSEQ